MGSDPVDPEKQVDFQDWTMPQTVLYSCLSLRTLVALATPSFVSGMLMRGSISTADSNYILGSKRDGIPGEWLGREECRVSALQSHSVEK